jgi:predicted nuclease with TOPRIM domain
MHSVIPSMKKITVSLEEDHLQRLRDRQENGDAGSRSGALREILDEYENLHTEYERLREEYEELHTRYEERGDRLEAREDRIEELEDQLRERSRVEEKIEDLPDKIRDRETYAERRQRALDEASVSQRLRWLVTGVPVEEIEDE